MSKISAFNKNNGKASVNTIKLEAKSGTKTSPKASVNTTLDDEEEKKKKKSEEPKFESTDETVDFSLGASKDGSHLMGAGIRTNIPSLSDEYKISNGSGKSRSGVDYSTMTQAEKDDNLIKQYEAIPNYNVFQRKFGVGHEAFDDQYKKKQELAPEYQQAKNRQTMRKVYDLGITDADLDAYIDSSNDKYWETNDKVNSLLQKNGIDVGDFAEAMRNRNDIKIAEDAKASPVMSTGFTFAAKPFEDAAGVLKKGANYLTGSGLQNNPTYSDVARNAISEDMSGLGKFAYGTGTSIGDMATSMGLGVLTGGGSWVASGLMGVEKANQVMNEAAERGLNPDQVMLEGAASGLTTAITEKIPMGRWENIARNGLTEVSAKQIAKVLAANAFPEAAQEMSEDIADTLADYLIAGDKSQIAQAIKEKGAAEAWKEWVLQTGLDGLGGLISGSVMGGGSMMLGGINQNANIPSLEENVSEEIPEISNEEMVEIENAVNEEAATEDIIRNLDEVAEPSEDEDILPLPGEDFTPEDVNAILPTLEESANNAPSEENAFTDENVNIPKLEETVDETAPATAESTKMKPSQTSRNTFTNSATFKTQKEAAKWMKQQIKDGTYDVDAVPESASVESAAANLEADYEGEIARLQRQNDISNVDIDESMMVTDNLVQEALKSNDWNKVREWTRTMNRKIHGAAQGLQALAKYTRTASGLIAKGDKMMDVKAQNLPKKEKAAAQKFSKTLERVLARIGYDGTMDSVPQLEETNYNKIYGEVMNTMGKESSSVFDNFNDTDFAYITRMIEQNASDEMIQRAIERKLATGYWEVSDTDLNRIVDLFNEADQYNPNSKKADDLRNEAYGIMAKYLGNGTFMEKWNAWRYLSMLGNTRTHIRNIMGNFLFGGVTNVKDNLAGVLEGVLNPEERQRSFVSWATDGNLMRATRDDFNDNAYVPATEGGNKRTMDRDIERHRKTFKDKGLGKAVNKANEINSKALDAEDVFAIRNKYGRALAGYLKANKKNASILTSTDPADVAFMEKARKFAIDEAKIATFHEDSKFADWLNATSKNAAQSDSLGVQLGGVAIESLMPYKKTPINIFKQGVIEYNPAVQIPKALGQTVVGGVNKARGKESKFTPSDVINSYAKGLTGAGIMALGAWLASKGILRGAGKDDEDYAQNEQEYSINWDNHSYTVDWMAPAALPLFMGVELYKAFNKEGLELSDITDAISAVGAPVIEMSMMSGIQSALENFSKATSDGDKFVAGLAGLGVGYGSQGIPTALGQIARATDKTRRSTYTGKEYGKASDVIMKQGLKTLNKIPGLSTLNEPYVDTFGNEQENAGGNFLGRLAYNTLSPGYYSETHTNEIVNELSDVKAQAQEAGIDVKDSELFPKAPDKKVDDKRLTPKEYTKAQKTKGQITTENLSALFESDLYKNASEQDKIDLIHEMNLFSNAASKAELYDYDPSASSTYKKKWEAYQEGGVNGLIDYMSGKYADKKEDESKEIPTLEQPVSTNRPSTTNLPSAAKLAVAGNGTVGNSAKAATVDMGSLDKSKILAGNSYVSATTAIPYLRDDLGYDDAQIGEVLYNSGQRSARETAAYDAYGYEGVATYYDIKSYGQTHGSTNVSKTEIKEYLSSLGYDDETINAWLKIMTK